MKRIWAGILFFSSVLLFAQESYPPRMILMAAFTGDLELAKKIIVTNPDRDVRDATGRTALHIATFQNKTDIVQILILNGWDVNAVCVKNGNTPLHDAVMANNPTVGKVLVNGGADKSIKNKAGLTPLDIAAQEGKREMILLLNANGKKR